MNKIVLDSSHKYSISIIDKHLLVYKSDNIIFSTELSEIIKLRVQKGGYIEFLKYLLRGLLYFISDLFIGVSRSNSRNRILEIHTKKEKISLPFNCSKKERRQIILDVTNKNNG